MLILLQPAINDFTSSVIKQFWNDKTIMLKITQYIAFYPICYIIPPIQEDGHGTFWEHQFCDFLYSADYFLNKLYSVDSVRIIQLMLLYSSCNFFSLCFLVF